MSRVLVTIPFSHFCEKARWALDAAGVAYHEEGHVPLLHRRATRRARGKGSVPILVLDDGAVLGESSTIVRFADDQAHDHRKLLPTDARARDEAFLLEQHFDSDFAPHVRRFVYFHLLASRPLTLHLFARQTPYLEQVIARSTFPFLRAAMRRFMAVNEARALESRDQIRRVFEEVGARIAGRQYLLGDRFGALDISFAALAAPILMPIEHPVLPPEREFLRLLPTTFVQEVDALRETPAGSYALRVYRDHRRASSPS